MSKKALWWVGTLILLPVALLAVAVLRFDPNDYKAALAGAVRQATGRALALNGPMRLQWSLQPRFTVADVTLANLPNGSRPDMARAEAIEIEISLAALLRRRIEVVKLTLVGPNVLFEQVDGAPNWVFAADAPPGGAAPGAAEAGAAEAGAATPSGLPLELRVRALHIQNGMVTWRFPARTKVVGIRSLDVRHPLDDGPLDLAGTLVYSDNQPFSIAASAQPGSGFVGPWTTRLTFNAFDTTATAQGMLDVTGAYDLRVEGRAGNLDRLNALLPEMALPPLRGVTLSTHLTNGRQPGDLPVIGETRLHVEGSEKLPAVPGLTLGGLDVALPAAGGQATIDGGGTYAGRLFRLAGTMGVPVYLDARNTVKLDLKAEAAGTGAAAGSLAVKGGLALDTLAFAGLDAGVSLRLADSAAWRDLLGAVPALADLRFDGQVALPADAGTLRIRAATLATRGFTLSGEGTAGLGRRRSLQARLQAKELALASLLDAVGIVPPAPRAPADATGKLIPDARLPWTGLQGFDLDLQGRVAALTAADRVWRDVDVAVQLNAGRLRRASLSSALPAGPLELAVSADTNLPEVPVTLSLRSPGVPLALIAAYAGLPGDASVDVRVDAQLQGDGATLRRLAASLDGSLSVTAIGGELGNDMLIGLTAASLEALGIKVPVPGRTRLDCLGLVGSFARGVGLFRTIALETTYLSLEGAGRVDLGQETLALKLYPLAQVSGSRVAVPVIVDGPFRAVSGRLDASGLDKVGLLIEGLFGGDTSRACEKAGLVRPRAAGAEP